MASNDTSVAILIPAYNPDGKLVALIDKLCERFRDILVVNDGSAGCEAVFEAVEAKGAHVISHETNRGKGAALQTGFRWIIEHLPSCSAVVTADADDMPAPDFIEAALAAAEKTSADVVAFGADEVDDRLGTRTPMPYLKSIALWADGKAHPLDELGAARFTTLGLAPWNKAVRRSLVEGNGISFQPVRRSNDVAFTVEVLAKASTFAAVDRSLIGYRVNNAKSLQWNNAETPTCFYEALLEAKQRLGGSHQVALRALAEEMIAYNLHSVRTVEAYRTLARFLAAHAQADFSVDAPISSVKGRGALCFRAIRAFETFRERGMGFCRRRVLGRVLRP